MTTGRINQIDNMCESVAFGKREAPVPAPKRGKSAGSRQWGRPSIGSRCRLVAQCHNDKQLPLQRHPPKSSEHNLCDC